MIVIRYKDGLTKGYNWVEELLIVGDVINMEGWKGTKWETNKPQSCSIGLSQVREIIIDGRTIYPTLEQIEGEKYGR